MPDTPDDRLDSWKEIAAYLRRGIRTVQRWEREEGLPVHRLAHAKRGTIYARRDELSVWWEGRKQALTQSHSTSDEPSPPRLERVTRTSAMTSWPALSSDARLVAYISDNGQDNAAPQIWIQQIGGTALRLTSGAHAYSQLSFATDDTRIIFTITSESGPNLYEVPTLGGDPRLLQRGATRGVMSPDGRWLASVPADAAGIRIAAHNGAGFRTVAASLLEVADFGGMTWLDNSQAPIVYARTDSSHEADWWIVPIDGQTPINTGVLRLFREAGLFTIPTGVACLGDSLVISGAGPQGIRLYRQRLDVSTFQPVGAPQRLTEGSESAWWPSAAAGQLLFFSTRADMNLWSVTLDKTTGLAHGPLQRMTRGPGVLGCLSLDADSRRLAYYSVRLGQADLFLRDLETGDESLVRDGPPGAKWDPAMSPNGTQLAYSTRTQQGDRAMRPIFVMSLSDGSTKTLADDSGGRPREWVDERRLLIQRFSRLNSVALIDLETGGQIDVVKSQDRSITNPRLSRDRRWIAFDALRTGEPSAVFVAPFRGELVDQSEWIEVDRAVTHPFWSADGGILYYTPIGTNASIRSDVRGRRFNSATGRPEGDPLSVYASTEMLMPAYLPGTSPIATPDQIILVLGDFRGDLWIMDVE